jgi:chitinase
MIAYLANWKACPSPAQLVQYTHVVISFATSYTWSNANRLICSPTCDIETLTVCENAPNPRLVTQLQGAGKKVLISFGGASMGGSWLPPASSNVENGCWEACFGHATQVVNRLVDIVMEMNLDGVDMDYEYFYDNRQNEEAIRGNFNQGPAAIAFLRNVTLGLRQLLPQGSLVNHAPMEPDIARGTAYFELLKELGPSLDYVLPQYYIGVLRPHVYGLIGRGNGSDDTSTEYSTLDHYRNIVTILWVVMPRVSFLDFV